MNLTTAQTDPETPPIQGQWRRIARVGAGWLLGFALLYGALLAIHRSFPYVQSGAALVAEMKHDLARGGNPFAGAASSAPNLKVMAFGHSKMLSGLIPPLLERDLAQAGVPRVAAYNFGLPGDVRFVEDLEALAAAGHAPDVALLIVPWPAQPPPGPTIFRFLDDDAALMDRLFPFRRLPRDLFILATEARGKPGEMARLYREAQRTIEQVRADRGYYFIKRQSHYPNDELPSDFTAPTDTPREPFVRDIPRGEMFERMAALCESHGILCVFIPSYFREGQYAPPPPPSFPAAATSGLAAPWLTSVGPGYELYPNRLFSDPIHLNPKGAEVYTRRIAELVAPVLRDRAARTRGEHGG